MTLQNRVDPFGAIHAAATWGMFTGNRGIIHDPETRTLLARRWTAKAWIVCDLVHPKARRRDVFGRNGRAGGVGWSELFFLDEVTALAAGHRPCFYCRREAATDFLNRYREAERNADAKAPDLDAMLHRQRLASGGSGLSLMPSEISSLPDGTMVALGDRAFALRRGALLPWSHHGYGRAAPSCRSLPDGDWRFVTPSATVAALRAGYEPTWHPSASG